MRSQDPRDGLIHAAPCQVLDRQLGSPMECPRDARSYPRNPSWSSPIEGRRNGWSIVQAGVLHQFAGAKLERAALLANRTISVPGRLVKQHGQFLETDEEYAARVAEVASRALAVWREAGRK